MRGAGSAVALFVVAVVAGCGGSGHRSALDPQAQILANTKQFCERDSRVQFAREQGFPAHASVAVIAHDYASEWPKGLRRLAYEGCMAGLTSVPPRFPASVPAARDVWGRNFVIAEATDADGGQPLEEPSRARFSFSREQEHSVGWDGICNGYGGNVRFTSSAMEVGGFAGTLVGCEPEVEKEDEWLADFLEADPEWQLDGERLTLSSDSGTLELLGFEDPRLCHLSPVGGRINLGNSGFGCESAIEYAGLHLRGEDHYLRGWRCDDSELPEGRLRVVCRDGKKWFVVSGLESR